MKYKFYFKTILSLSTVIILILLLNTCNKNSIPTETQVTQLSFPNFFIEKGSDIDTTYISLRGIKINYDTLEIQATSWGIVETGLLLSRQDLDKEILFRIMGRCGSISSVTWKKVTLKSWLTAKEIETLQKISFANYRDTISVVKTTTTS